MEFILDENFNFIIVMHFEITRSLDIFPHVQVNLSRFILSEHICTSVLT